MIKILTIFAIIYILSTVRMYFWIRNAYSKGGIFGSLADASFSSFLLTILPFINTLGSIVVSYDSITGKKEKDFIDWNKFFGIKQ